MGGAPRIDGSRSARSNDTAHGGVGSGIEPIARGATRTIEEGWGLGEPGLAQQAGARPGRPDGSHPLGQAIRQVGRNLGLGRPDPVVQFDTSDERAAGGAVSGLDPRRFTGAEGGIEIVDADQRPERRDDKKQCDDSRLH